MLSELAKLDFNKPVCHNSFSPIFLKDCCHELASSVYLLFNRSLREGTIPQGWRNSKLTAVCKREKFKSVENNRPISLLPVISKVSERVYTHLYNQSHTTYLSNRMGSCKPNPPLPTTYILC